MGQDLPSTIDSYSTGQNSSCFMEPEISSVFTKSHHWTLFSASSVQFAASHPVSLDSF